MKGNYIVKMTSSKIVNKAFVKELKREGEE